MRAEWRFHGSTQPWVYTHVSIWPLVPKYESERPAGIATKQLALLCPRGGVLCPGPVGGIAVPQAFGPAWGRAGFSWKQQSAADALSPASPQHGAAGGCRMRHPGPMLPWGAGEGGKPGRDESWGGGWSCKGGCEV